MSFMGEQKVTYNVTMVDSGCDCCSYITVASFKTLEEAKTHAGNDRNLIIIDSNGEEHDLDNIY